LDKVTYIWGAGHYGVLTALDLENKGVKIKGFIDKNAKAIKTRLGLPVLELNELKNQNIRIIIAVRDEYMVTEIMETLSLHGLKFEVSSLVPKPREYFEMRKKETLDLIPTLKPLESKNSPKYIVSLTSYGKRLSDTAPYAIITLFDQSVKPDKIVLWVAHEDKENIPQIMKELVQKGLEIRFCEDIKSYKKLVFAIEAFPDDYIITADDDIYYPKNWLEQLIDWHKKYPEKIICHRAHGIKVDENHNPLAYMQWDSSINPSAYFYDKKTSQSIFPTGGAGTLYLPKCFHKDITNKELFMNLAPHADDIWFWAMVVTNRENPYIVIENGYSKYLQSIESQQSQEGNALWNYNGSQGGNDIQLKAVIEHYPQIKEYLNKIEPTNETNIDAYKFQIDSECVVSGYMEPAHVKIDLDINDHIQKQIFYNGTYEKETVKKLNELLPQDGIFFDIGANIGVYSLNVFRKAKEVFAFEATKTTYDKLNKIITDNEIKNIHLNFNAVDDKNDKEVSIFLGNKFNNGSNSMFNKGIVANTVKTITLDAFIKRNSISRIDIIKIDIEGNELYALKGAVNSIKKYRPVIFCEINPELNMKAGYTAEELYNFIVKELKYEAMILRGNHFRKIPIQDASATQRNIFFFPT
jgi:FkbM family methyltransferase